MSLIQFFIVVFALFAIARTWRQFRKGKLTLMVFFVWVLFWLIVGVVVVLPQTTDTLARFVGVGRGVDAIMYVSIIALFYAVFRLLVRIEEVEREITKLVRVLGVEKAQKDEKIEK
jgi:hypothetical protein